MHFISQLGTNRGGIFKGPMCVLVCPKNSGYITECILKMAVGLTQTPTHKICDVPYVTGDIDIDKIL